MAEITAPQIEAPAVPPLPAGVAGKGGFNDFIANTLKAGQETREFAQSMRESLGNLLPQYQKALDYEADVLQARKGQVDARKQQLEGIAQQGKDIAVPEEPKFPEVPHTPVRAFGEGQAGESAAQTLQRTMLSLGLMAQMGMGIAKNYPQGALAAFSGALRGWQEGDREAAQREWLEYQAQVNKATREWRASVARFEMLRQKHGDDLEQFKLQLGLDFARNGADDKMVQMMFRAPEEAQKLLGMQGQVWMDLAQFNQHLNTSLMQADVERQRLDIQRQHEKALQDRIRAIQVTPGGTGFTPAALRMHAESVADGGPMPALGVGRAGTEARQAVSNMAAEIRAERGDTEGSLALKQMQYKANQSELSQLQAQRGKIMTFMATTDKNLDDAVKVMDKVDNTGTPAFNRWVNAGRRNIAGDPVVADLHAAVTLAAGEAAKVIVSATGGGVTSDAARQEINSVINAAQTPEQFKAVVARLKKDMQNRKESYEEHIADLKSQISPTAKSIPKVLSPEDYAEAKRRGFNDEQIRQKGYLPPRG